MEKPDKVTVIRCRVWGCLFIRLLPNGKWKKEKIPKNASIVPRYDYCKSCEEKQIKRKESWRWKVMEEGFED